MQALTLAIFDLDHTLLDADCSARWAAHMQDLGWADRHTFAAQHAALMSDYGERGLDMHAYLDLTLAPLAGRSESEVAVEVQRLVDSQLLPRVYPEALELLAAHRAAGHTLLLVSASEEFLVRPMGEALGFQHIHGVPCEVRNGRYSGRSQGLLTYAEGKVHCLENWLLRQHAQVQQSYFYSDSHNDLPLLEWCSQPRPTNPNARLMDEAERRGWDCRWLTPAAA
jgi:HAD superfamily hydrolase (TIGR01490 family)